MKGKYYAEKREMALDNKSGAAASKRRPWPMFQSMEFLRDIDGEAKGNIVSDDQNTFQVPVPGSLGLFKEKISLLRKGTIKAQIHNPLPSMSPSAITACLITPAPLIDTQISKTPLPRSPGTPHFEPWELVSYLVDDSDPDDDMKNGMMETPTTHRSPITIQERPPRRALSSINCLSPTIEVLQYTQQQQNQHQPKPQVQKQQQQNQQQSKEQKQQKTQQQQNQHQQITQEQNQHRQLKQEKHHQPQQPSRGSPYIQPFPNSANHHQYSENHQQYQYSTHPQLLPGASTYDLVQIHIASFLETFKETIGNCNDSQKFDLVTILSKDCINFNKTL